MKYFVWDENAQAFTVMAIGCAGTIALLILICFVCCIKSCFDNKRVAHMDEIEKVNKDAAAKYMEQKQSSAMGDGELELESIVSEYANDQTMPTPDPMMIQKQSKASR
jgi:hypothetical protein